MQHSEKIYYLSKTTSLFSFSEINIFNKQYSKRIYSVYLVRNTKLKILLLN